MHARSSINAVTVLAEISNALAPPIGFIEVWNDQGSGAHTDIRVMWMNPPSGYTCLGYVAMVGYHSLPNIIINIITTGIALLNK